jgi:NADH-quinone oxidoreductase subunit M
LPFLGGTTIILGAYYMLKMYQQVMLGETNTKYGCYILRRICFTIILYSFFGMYPKPITDLITPSLENILTHINRIN